jgi:hypothetical protein
MAVVVDEDQPTQGKNAGDEGPAEAAKPQSDLDKLAAEKRSQRGEGAPPATGKKRNQIVDEQGRPLPGEQEDLIK